MTYNVFGGTLNPTLHYGRKSGWRPTRGWRRLEMLEDLYENNSYEVLKRTAEDRSAWRKSMRKKVSKTCCVVDS